MISNIISAISSAMYDWILIIMLIAAGIYFTVASKFPQFRLLGRAIKCLKEKPKNHNENSVSGFQALMVSTASRVGTGNIIGVSVAICVGGYGSVFWMWVIALIGGATAFAESTLAQIYKVKGKDGKFIGGPAYYIEKALNFKVLAIVFCIAMLLTYAFGFNMLASYNLQTTFAIFPFYDPSITPWIIGIILAVVTGWCLLGGESRIVKVTSGIVPVMGIAYVIISVIVIVINAGNMPMVFQTIFQQAFNFKAIFAGFGASVLMQGIRRGLYSNEAGIGSAPNAAASADTSHPAKQGLIQMISVFIDTLILCTATAMMCMSSGIVPVPEIKGAPYVQMALGESLGAFGPYFIVISMSLFAFTTLLGNCFYCDNLLTYLNGKKEPSRKFMIFFRLICAGVIFLGSGLEAGLLWDISDVCMGLMAIINIPVLFILSRQVFRTLKDFERKERLGDTSDFKSKDIGLRGRTECWETADVQSS